jgi:hypothetical protein
MTTTTAVEMIPTTWDDALDGATVTSTTRTGAEHCTSATPATVDTRTRPGGDLVPVRVRRTR